MSNEKLEELLEKLEMLSSYSLYLFTGNPTPTPNEKVELVKEIGAMRDVEGVDFSIAVPALMRRLEKSFDAKETQSLIHVLCKTVKDERYSDFAMNSIIEKLNSGGVLPIKLSKVLYRLAVEGFDITPAFSELLELMGNRNTSSDSLSALDNIKGRFINEEHVRQLREKMKEILRNEKNERRKLKLKIEFTRIYTGYIWDLSKSLKTPKLDDVKTLKLPPKKEKRRFRLIRLT